jgi:membrane protein YdbS with pleckstrin-like domain
MDRRQLYRRCIVKRLIEELSDGMKSTMIGIGYILAVAITFLLVDFGRNPLSVVIGVALLWFYLVIAPVLIIYLSARMDCREAPGAS